MIRAHLKKWKNYPPVWYFYIVYLILFTPCILPRPFYSLNLKPKTMKSFRFLLLPFLAVSIICITSCNGSEDKSTTDATVADSSNAGTTTADVTPPSTIVTTPQNMMLAKHRVRNYAAWKSSYDAHDSLRLANGLHSYVIGRGVQDSNNVFVAVKADDPEKAKTFSKDASLKQAMQKGGVLGTPDMKMVTLVWQDTSTLNTPVRSMTTFTVKDWTTWEKSFLEGKQQRMDNGLADRVYGYETDDNKKVVLVVAVLDSAKANAYWKSDQLKQRRAAGGVVTEPQRFIFNVVQRY
jgi:hypothetical protein